MTTPPNNRPPRRGCWWLAAVMVCLPLAGWSETVILKLSNGDQVSGELVSADTNQVVLTTSWSGKLTVPTPQIVSRTEIIHAGAVANGLGAQRIKTNVPPPLEKRWKAEAQVGLDFAYGIQRKEIYYGKFRLDYKRPYTSDPQESFRNTFDDSLEYGKTDNVNSDNRMDGGVDTEFDFSRRMFVYNIARLGYDEIRQIDLQYELGPGLGYHLIQKTNFTANLGLGVDYQERFEADGTDNQSFFSRLAQDTRWQINHRVVFDEKLEYFLSPVQARARFEANLKYLLLHNVSLNLTVEDLYDTQPAVNVDQNELRIRSSLGVTF